MLKLQPFPILCDKTLTFCLLRITIHYTNLSKHWKSIWWMNTPDQMIDRSCCVSLNRKDSAVRLCQLFPWSVLSGVWKWHHNRRLPGWLLLHQQGWSPKPNRWFLHILLADKWYFQIDLFMHIPFYLPVHIHHNNKVFSYQVNAYTVWILKDIQFS